MSHQSAVWMSLTAAVRVHLQQMVDNVGQDTLGTELFACTNFSDFQNFGFSEYLF